LTNRWSVSGYGGLGLGGHLTTPLITARCKLPPCSARAYSKGDIPYLKQQCIGTLLDKNRRWDYNNFEFFTSETKKATLVVVSYFWLALNCIQQLKFKYF